MITLGSLRFQLIHRRRQTNSTAREIRMKTRPQLLGLGIINQSVDGLTRWALEITKKRSP